MSAQISPVNQKTAKPVVAGIFNIVVGSCCMLGVLAIIVIAFVTAPLSLDIPFRVGYLFALISLPLAAIGIVSIIGGIFELQRRMWGWALAGSITTALVSNVLGIVSIILTAVSKDEFVQ
jgi:hypothetical protein